MSKKPTPIDPKQYEEEAVPFDDVMRQLLAAKPQHKKAKPAKKPKGKKKPKTS